MFFPIIDSRRCASLPEAVRALTEFLRSRGVRSALLGLSGGADSVLTFHLLRLAAARLHCGFRLGVCHVNFQLRGVESRRDENFVRSLIEAFPPAPDVEIIPFFASYDTSAYCAERGLSIEMGARELRHTLFRDLMRRDGFQALATGHNADDNDETLMLNLLRGSGSAGLKAMQPFTPDPAGCIIRPILDLLKENVADMLKQVEYPDTLLRDYPDRFITDSSNLTNDYRRNFLRHRVLPLIAREWPGTHAAMQRTLSIAAEEHKIVQAALRNALAGAEEDFLSWDIIANFPSPLTLIHAWLRDKGGSPQTAIEIAAHVPAPGEECSTPGRRWNLNSESVVTTPKGLRLQDESARSLRCIWEQITLTSENCKELMLAVKKASQAEVFLPYPEEAYSLRMPRPGDRIRLFGRHGSKLVSDVLKEAGVPPARRADIPLLVNNAGGEIVWIPGIRRAGADLIDFTDLTSATTIYHATII